jgi:hypothetical protein
MATISETELQKRLHKLEYGSSTSSPLVHRVDGVYEYTRDYVYVAYASDIQLGTCSLSQHTNQVDCEGNSGTWEEYPVGVIQNQSEATDFQYSPYTTGGNLLSWMGHFVSRSVHPSGDPVDYIWESTAGNTGFTTERQYSTSTDLKLNIGDPQTEPSLWTTLTAVESIPSTAVWLAERHQLNYVYSGWEVTPISNYVSATFLTTGSVTADAILANQVKASKIDVDDKIQLGNVNDSGVYYNKTSLGDASAGLFLGTDTSGSNTIAGLHIGNLLSYIKLTSEVGTGGESEVTLANTKFLATAGADVTQTYKSVGTRTLDISGLTVGTDVTYKIWGAGGGGGSNGGTTGTASDANDPLVTYSYTNGSVGEDSTIKVINSSSGTSTIDTGTGGAGGTGNTGSATAGSGGDATGTPDPSPNANGGNGGAGESSATAPVFNMNGGNGGAAAVVCTGTYTTIAGDITLQVDIGAGGEGGAGDTAQGGAARGGFAGGSGYIEFSIDLGGAASEVFKIETDAVTSYVDVVVNGNVTADEVIDRSDVRLKTDISPIRNALEIVKDLEGVVYTRKDSGKRETGVIAQDVEEVFPFVVSENSDGYLGVAYGRMVGLLIEAVKDLSEQVEELKRGD